MLSKRGQIKNNTCNIASHIKSYNKQNNLVMKNRSVVCLTAIGQEENLGGGDRNVLIFCSDMYRTV